VSLALPVALDAVRSESTGRYRLGRQLAEGGMGTILLAFDTFARRDVAYKRLRVLNESSRPRVTALFEREYNTLSQLAHPNIVEVYDYGLDAEGPYYTMELLAGEDLAAVAPLSVSDACRLLRDVASALALLHARRLLHRDVTPANVRLTQQGRAKLIDFGALTEFGKAREIVGTPSFIAPECLAGEPLDQRTDLFALGGLAYWALTRRHAYPARSMGELLDTWEIPPAAPSTHAPEVPKELDELVLSLLEREAVARPPTAAHVIERLTAIANLLPEPEQQRVAYSYLLHPPLVGRDDTLARLRRYCAETVEGRGRTVVVEAGAGLGRSALLDQLAIDAQLAGASVLRWQPGVSREGALAYSVLSWMLGLFPDLAKDLIQRESALGSILSRTTRAARSRSLAPAQLADRRANRVLALQRSLEEASELSPLVLVVDDVHRADAESLALLASLARSTLHAPILLVASKREATAASDANALANLEAGAARLVLTPLQASHVEQLVYTIFGEVPNGHRLARWLHEQSGGNPGQCMDLSRLLLSRGEIRYTLGTFALPFDVREVSGADAGSALQLTRLSELSADALSLVRLLSLHESALNHTQLGTAAGLDPRGARAAGSELCARGLTRASGDYLAFTSESLRAALRDSLAPEERAALHARLASALAASDDASLEGKFAVAHHLVGAGKPDEALALVWDGLQQPQGIPLSSVASLVPTLEKLLAHLREQGHPDEHLSALLVPLVFAGFWGDPGSMHRNRDAALAALANLSGMDTARELTPRLGPKLALYCGMAHGALRHLRTPSRFRAQSYAGVLQRLIAVVSMSTASAIAAMDPKAALRIAATLDPIRALPQYHPARVAGEFCVATAELGAGRFVSAARRYAWLMEQLDKPERKFEPRVRDVFYDGCVHGRAQAEANSGSPGTLVMAEELSRRHPFYKPHVEVVKMTYRGYRGEKELADAHRQQGEILALRGGTSWTAFVVMSVRSAYFCMLSRDTLGVLRASVELDRLAEIAPNVLVYRDLCRAYIDLVRGQQARSAETYERVFGDPDAWLLPTWYMDRSFYADALLALGQADRAKAVCLETLQEGRVQEATPYMMRVPNQQLALIEAALGNHESARDLLELLSPVVLASDSPLAIGALHRDQARVALITRDSANFDKHFEAMLGAFRKSKNPALIQQCRRLLAEAERAGVATAPAWQKHELTAPENTQDLLSQAPEVTEVVDTIS
jgi:Protein kinase domain/AAA ATPase domain